METALTVDTPVSAKRVRQTASGGLSDTSDNVIEAGSLAPPSASASARAGWGSSHNALAYLAMDSDEAYRVQENTEVPAHPSIDTVISRELKRAADPRPTNHSNGHFDRYIRDTLDRFGEDDVVNCIHLTLLDGYTHRMAGTADFGKEDYVWGINVGVAATAYLRELH